MYIKEINKIFTEEVNAFLRMGWTINAQTMSGMSCSEIAKVDLTNGKDVIRIMMCEDSEDLDNGDEERKRFYGFLREIVIEKKVMLDEAKPNERVLFPRWNTYYTRKFYEMPRSDRRWFTEDRDEVLHAEMKQDERRDARRVNNNKYFRNYPITANLLPLIRRFPRCKTAHLEDVTEAYCVFRGNSRIYTFRVKGNTHEIVVHTSERW